MTGHLPRRDVDVLVVGGAPGYAGAARLAAEAALRVGAGLVSVAAHPDAVPGLLELLDDPTAVARPEVLLALGRLRDARAVDVIARDLYSDRPEVRVAAATALGDIGGATDLEALDALKGDYYRRVREAVELATGAYRPTCARGGLRRAGS